MPLTITLPQVLDAHTDGRLLDLHTCIPATVQSWDPATQLATVQPVARKPMFSADEILVYEDPPAIANVPVMVLRGGGFLVSVPVAQGDSVWLMFSEQSYAEWYQTGKLSSPKDIRRHGIGYPFAIPGLAPQSGKLASVSSSALVVGKDTGDPIVTIDGSNIVLGRNATDAVALNSKVLTELNNIKLSIAAGCNTATGSPITPYVPGASVGSTLIKAK